MSPSRYSWKWKPADPGRPGPVPAVAPEPGASAVPGAQPPRPRRRRRPGGQTPPPIVSSDLGTFDPPRAQPHRPDKRWEARQEAALGNQTALLNMWQQMSESLGGILDLTKAAAPGDVLGNDTMTIPGAGVIERRFPAGFQSVAVTNYSGSALTIVAGPAQGANLPTVGPGVFLVPAGVWRVINIRGAVVTVYGAAGIPFDITSFSRPQAPNVGLVGTNQTPLGVSASFAAGAAGSVVLTPAATKTAYLTDVLITTTTAAAGVLTITGLAIGTIDLEPGANGLVWPLKSPQPAATVGGAITLTVPVTDLPAAYALALAGYQQ